MPGHARGNPTGALIRRHLGPIAWANAFERLLKVRGVRAEQGARNDEGETSETVSEVAKEHGVTDKTARNSMTLARQLEPAESRLDHRRVWAHLLR